MGSLSKTELAYIAGFLDGDGSLMLQLKKRSSSKIGWRFMGTICLYQDTRHEDPLFWIQHKIGIGYISRRKDGITELRINGFKQIKTLLLELLPYLRFKHIQAVAVIDALNILSSTEQRKLTKDQLIEVIDDMITVQNHNYVTRQKNLEQSYFQYWN